VVVVATACAGHDEVAGYAQWAADAPVWALTALGVKSDPLTGRVTAPSESTLRRALREVDAGDLQRLTARWVAASWPARSRRTVSGCPRWPSTVKASAEPPLVVQRARTCWEQPPTMARSWLPRTRYTDKSSEITELATLVAELDLTGACCHRRCPAHPAQNRRTPRQCHRRGLPHDDQGEPPAPAGRCGDDADRARGRFRR
jgi:hypothetical protein